MWLSWTFNIFEIRGFVAPATICLYDTLHISCWLSEYQIGNMIQNMIYVIPIYGLHFLSCQRASQSSKCENNSCRIISLQTSAYLCTCMYVYMYLFLRSLGLLKKQLFNILKFVLVFLSSDIIWSVLNNYPKKSWKNIP